MAQQIQEIHRESRRTYGAPTPTATLRERIHALLKAKGFHAGRHRVARLMRQQGICVRPKSRFKTTTDSNHPFPIAENMLNRNFSAAEPDKAWVADITYILTHQGWLYLAVVIDLFSRRVVGWSIAEHMRTELVLSALFGCALDIGLLLHLGFCSIQTEVASMPVAIIERHSRMQGLSVV